MTDRPRYIDPDVGPDHEPPTGTPRWVKVVGIIVIVVILALLMVGLVTGGHGPGRH
jgi:hypothetical protein